MGLRAGKPAPSDRVSSLITSGRPGRTRLLGIEAARGIAAMLVVFYHAARHLEKANGSMPWGGAGQLGHAGVDFFFVLSGFIILYVHRMDIGAPAMLGHYLKRRFMRVYPLFWIALAVWTVLALLSGSGDRFTPAELLLQASLLPNNGEAGVAWTLQNEILFYAMFGIAILHRRLGMALFATWFVAIGISWTLGDAPLHPALLHRLLSTFNIEFLFGMAAAYAVQTWTIARPGMLLGTGVLVFFGYGLCENLGMVDGYASSAHIFYGAGAMLAVMGLAHAEAAGALPVPPLLRRLGAASYSIYLFHLPCIGIVYKVLAVSGLLARLPVGVTYGLLVAGSVTGGVLVSTLIEYPLMKLINFRRPLVQQHV